MGHILKNKFLKVFILVATLLIFAYYFFTHQAQFAILSQVTWWQVVLIVLGQTLVLISNILILILFVRFIQKKISFADSARITAYSSLVNFFGFLQGGVALRAVYLKKRFSMTFRRYVALTSLQYLVLFALSGFIIFIGISIVTGISYSVIVALSGIIIIAAITTLLFKLRVSFVVRAVTLAKQVLSTISARPLLTLMVIVILQLSGSLLANFIELMAIGANLSLGSLLIYTGVSQFAVVIAITPGAVGIREALLLIVQGQMHLSTQDIVLAATLDRLVYFITLALLTPLAIGIKKQLPKIES